MDSIYYQSPIGWMQITGNEAGITGLDFIQEPEDKEEEAVPQLLKWCRQELHEYFEGKRFQFTIPLQVGGTAFQQDVWKALIEIPYGKTASYKDIAAGVQRPKAVRAVGSANHNNKIAIIIPCHRVVGTNGKLVGYAGGLDKKQWLLEHEQRFFHKIA